MIHFGAELLDLLIEVRDPLIEARDPLIEARDLLIEARDITFCRRGVSIVQNLLLPKSYDRIYGRAYSEARPMRTNPAA